MDRIPEFLRRESARDCAARWAEKAREVCGLPWLSRCPPGVAPRIPDFLRKSVVTDHIPELRRVEREIREEVSSELRACFKSDTATDLKRKEEHARYLRDSFAGRCEDWLQWPTDEQKEKALDEIYHALRLSPEDALLRVQLIVSGLIVDAATGHVAACIRNGKL